MTPSKQSGASCHQRENATSRFWREIQNQGVQKLGEDWKRICGWRRVGMGMLYTAGKLFKFAE